MSDYHPRNARFELSETGFWGRLAANFVSSFRPTTLTRVPGTSADTRLELTSAMLSAALSSMLILFVLAATILVPLFSANKRGAYLVLTSLGIFALGIPAVLLRRGRIMAAAWSFCVSGAIIFTVLASLSGGARSPATSLQLAVAITAAVLIGRRSLYLCGAIVLVDLLFSFGERAGITMPLLFPGRPVAILLLSMIFALPLVYKATAWLAGVLDACREQKDRVEEVSRLKSEFLANMSHEFRTPMNAILGFTTLAMDTPSPEERKECLQGVITAGNSLLSLLDDILLLTELEAGRTDLAPSPFSIAGLMQETATILWPHALQKGLELRFDVEPGVPDEVLGDPLRLAKVLWHVVGNAVKFTDRGSVMTKAEVASRQPDSVEIRFSVCDTGPGIPADKQETIFESFRQADGSASRTHGGAGLGLTLSSRLVGIMGGRMWLESKPGSGATFYFTARLGQPGRRTMAPSAN